MHLHYNIMKFPANIVEQVRKHLDPTPCGLVRHLVEAGHEAYIVGGAIRDLLLGASPKDYDIVTSATPEEIRRVFGRRRCHIIGRRFRLVHVYANGDLYEISTFRRIPSEKERQGRHANGDDHIIWNDNCFGTLEDDATRRDFTANALYFDVVGSRGIIDFWGSYQDIRDRRVRCIGKPTERMEEDPVRMLRALKLVGQFGFKLDPELDAVIREQASNIQLASPSRLFEELLKILKHPAADQTLQEMHNHGFLKYFWNLLDVAWDDQEGKLARHLLKLRGEAIRRGNYSNSRGLALATVSTPFLLTAMNPAAPTDFWTGSLTYNQTAQRALQLIFDGFLLPNAFAHRILEIIDLIPRMLRTTPEKREKLFKYKEYRYGRALLSLLVQAFGWDSAKILADLPEVSPSYDSWNDPQELFDLDASLAEEQPVEAEPVANGTEAQPSEEPKPTTRRSRKKTPRQVESVPTSTSTEMPATSKEESSPAALPSKHGNRVVPLRKSPTDASKTPPRISFDEKPETNLKRVEIRPKMEVLSPAPKKYSDRLISLRKDGQRVPLPNTEILEPAKPAGKVEFNTSFITAPPRKRRAASETESITFSPTTSKPTSRKRSAGSQTGEFKA